MHHVGATRGSLAGFSGDRGFAVLPPPSCPAPHDSPRFGPSAVLRPKGRRRIPAMARVDRRQSAWHQLDHGYWYGGTCRLRGGSAADQHLSCLSRRPLSAAAVCQEMTRTSTASAALSSGVSTWQITSGKLQVRLLRASREHLSGLPSIAQGRSTPREEMRRGKPGCRHLSLPSWYQQGWVPIDRIAGKQPPQAETKLPQWKRRDTYTCKARLVLKLRLAPS